MTKAEALERAKKLLALGESENEHEAALATAQAQRILERFEIELAELGSIDAEAEPMTEGSWSCGGKRTITHWRLRVADALAHANGCTLFYSGPRVTCCGRRSDVRRVANFWSLVCSEVERISRIQCRGRGARYANSFKMGCAASIRAEIKRESDELRAEMRGTVRDTALVVVDTRRKDASTWMKSKHRLGRGGYGGTVGSRSGYAEGAAAGAGAYGSATRGRVSGGSAGRLGSGA
jgi:hypothetical protein